MLLQQILFCNRFLMIFRVIRFLKSTQVLKSRCEAFLCAINFIFFFCFFTKKKYICGRLLWVMQNEESFQKQGTNFYQWIHKWKLIIPDTYVIQKERWKKSKIWFLVLFCLRKHLRNHIVGQMWLSYIGVLPTSNESFWRKD